MASLIIAIGPCNCPNGSHKMFHVMSNKCLETEIVF